MKKNLISIVIQLFVVCLLSGINNLTAGIVMVDEDGSKTFISNGKLKEISEDDGMIMDSKTGDFTYFSQKKKIYTQGKISDFCESMKQMMDQMIAMMPLEYQKMLGIGEEQKPPKVEIVFEGDGGTLATYNTEKFKIMVDGKIHETIWLATDKSLVNEFKSLVEMISEFQKCSKIMDFGTPPVQLSPEYLELMGSGLTLKSIEYKEGIESITTNTASVEIKDIPDAEFKVPQGYEKMSFSEYFSSQMGGEEDEF